MTAFEAIAQRLITEAKLLEPHSIQAFLWSNRTGLTDFGMGGSMSSGSDINIKGVVAGTFHSAGRMNAFVWTQQQGIQELGWLPDTIESWAVSINDGGLVAGSSRGYGTNRAFLWEKNIGMQDLGTLGGPSSWPAAMNGFGDVVGLRPAKDMRSFGANTRG